MGPGLFGGHHLSQRPKLKPSPGIKVFMPTENHIAPKVFTVYLAALAFFVLSHRLLLPQAKGRKSKCCGLQPVGFRHGKSAKGGSKKTRRGVRPTNKTQSCVAGRQACCLGPSPASSLPMAGSYMDFSPEVRRDLAGSLVHGMVPS